MRINNPKRRRRSDITLFDTVGAWGVASTLVATLWVFSLVSSV